MSTDLLKLKISKPLGLLVRKQMIGLKIMSQEYFTNMATEGKVRCDQLFAACFVILSDTPAKVDDRSKLKYGDMEARVYIIGDAAQTNAPASSPRYLGDLCQQDSIALTDSRARDYCDPVRG
jgi:hypothetical protein